MSETNPQGLSLFYEYDTNGRLERIIDSNKKIITQYNYNYGKPLEISLP